MGKMIRESAGWKKPAWVAVRPEVALAKAVGMGAEECKAWVVQTLASCISGEREEGSDADILLRESLDRIEKKRQQTSAAGKKSAERRAARAAERKINSRSTGVQQPFNGRSTGVQHTDTDNNNNKSVSEIYSRVRGGLWEPDENLAAAEWEELDERRSEIVTAMRNEHRRAEQSEEDDGQAWGEEEQLRDKQLLEDCDLPAFAAWYCQDEQQEKALRTYSKAFVENEAKFREVLYGFVDDVESGTGGDMESRGKIFVFRLKEAGFLFGNRPASPESKTKAEKQLRERLSRLFNRPPTTEWSKAEGRLLAEVATRPGVEEELEAIERLYRSDYKRKRKNVYRLLYNWTAELDRAGLYFVGDAKARRDGGGVGGLERKSKGDSQ